MKHIITPEQLEDLSSFESKAHIVSYAGIGGRKSLCVIHTPLKGTWYHVESLDRVIMETEDFLEAVKRYNSL